MPQRIRLHPRQTPDWWPRIAIVSGFLSGVVIAAISLITSASLQRAQMLLTKQSADAQIEMSRRKAEDDKRIQEGQVTAQFVQHLIGKDAVQREIAIISLRTTIPDVSDNILDVMARRDADPDVRALAIEQLSRSTSAKAAATLNNIAHDASRPHPERDLAAASNLQVAIRQTVARTAADQNTFVLAATSATDVVRDSSEFTDAIIRGLSGAADEDHDGLVSGPELGRYVAVTVATMANWQGFSQQPIWLSRGPADVILAGRTSTGLSRYYSKTAVLVIAPSPGELRPLPVAAHEAREFATALEKRGALVELLTGTLATRSGIENAVIRLSNAINSTDLFMLYFVGNTSVMADGQIRWWLAGSKESLTPADLNRLIDRIATKNKAIFINSCYAGAVVRQ